jgi:4-diphosphocytidyl-2-C-methyl-D-erythritol kinase
MPSYPLTRQAPAKLNLFLHITGRCSDGYHLLQSVFMLIDWCDTLHFELRMDGKILREDVLNTTGQSLPEVDLAVQAARALQAASNTRLGATIYLEKRIPSEAGMGGGSSDAATTLLALNEVWDTNLSLRELAILGARLGADVPFFLYQKHAWVEGIGEKITPIELPTPLKAARFLVVKPATGLSTPAVFASPDLVRNTKTATIKGFAAWTESNASQQCLGQFGCNDLQPVAIELCPQIAQALEWLKNQGLKPRMTGSGSAVFAQVPDSYALNAASSLPAGWYYRLCSNEITP